jgi:hypothetical protein
VRRYLALLAAAVALAGAGRAARGAEVHTLFDGACRRTSGVMVHVSEQTVTLVGLDGELVVRARGDVAAITVHKTLENPLARIALGDGLREHLRDVWVGDDDQPTFTGWTAAFFDDLFLYFDLEGQTHVLDPEEIRSIRRSSITGAEARPRAHAAVDLAFPSAVVPCGAGTAVIAPDAVLPSRVIADRIKVGDYLGKLEQRYLAEAGFEERTFVYAEPFVFDPESRLGLLYDPEWRFAFPLYFRWSNGRPYRFQSLSVVGNASHEWLPELVPSMSVRSDIKSHFFNATFIGHILALPAGTDAFLLDEAPDVQPGETPEVDHSYNYLLLMGADYWRLSASFGATYRATRIVVPEAQPRVLLAGSLSPTARLRYQGSRLELRALYFRTRSSGSVSEAFGDDFDEGDDELAERYHWRLDTVRVGATWRPVDTVEIMVDQLGSRGAYRDAYQLGPVALTMWEFATSGEVGVSFGRYVTVKGNARLYLKRYRTTRPAASEESAIEPRFGGALEFVF